MAKAGVAGGRWRETWRSRRRLGLRQWLYRGVQSLLRRSGAERWMEWRLHQIIGIRPMDLRLPARLARGLEVREAGATDLAAMGQLRAPVGAAYGARLAQSHRAIAAYLGGRMVAFVWVVRGPARLPTSFGNWWQINGGMAWLYDLYSHPEVLGAVPHLYAWLAEHPPGPGVRFYVGQTDYENRRSWLAHRSLGYQTWAQLWTWRCGGCRRQMSRRLTRGADGLRWHWHGANSPIALARMAPPAEAPAAAYKKLDDLEVQCGCGRQLATREEEIVCVCGRRLGSNQGGVLCLGEAVPYWGEIPEMEMRALLADAGQRGWRTAAREHLSRGLYEYVCGEERAAFDDLLPLAAGARVLDIGAGWGSIAAPLARRYSVVAVEGVEERARFLELRRQQDGLTHLRVVRGELHNVPLALGQFDAIIANGVLEWAALLDAPVSPEQVQWRFLDRLRELLAPGGCIYLAIENRFGWPVLRGSPDHSGLPYTSLLPRPLARWVCDHSHAYRSQFNVGYRTYTYSYGGYRRLFRRAGLEVEQSWVCTQGYNHPEKMVPLDRAAIRFATCRRPQGRLRRWARRLEAQPWVWRSVGSDFAFLLRAREAQGAAVQARRGHA